MPGRDFLDRFRPAAAPGAVDRVGVPAAEVEDAALLAVLAALGPTQAAADAIRAEARQAGQTRLERADSQARAVLARAELDAAEQRATAAARAVETGARESAEVLAEAAAGVTELRRRGDRHLPEVVARVLEVLLESTCPVRVARASGTGAGDGRHDAAGAPSVGSQP
jgi:vacuolar-type H+-ATPase subunit H